MRSAEESVAMCTSMLHVSCTEGPQVSNPDWTLLVDLCMYICFTCSHPLVCAQNTS
ncbi:hypothetical protein K439DRAFT_166481 [Ramaria rubella]|nr:hypothetical protein K439DRAFT_166481 [Ramaria rubella]